MMSMTYWIVLWLIMLLAFGLAWAFIVKGCEAMDSRHPDASESDAGHDRATPVGR